MSNNQNKKIGKALVIDDLEMNRHLFKTILNNINFEVDLANNGKDGVTAIATSLTSDRQYDIVFLDMMMPEMNGVECAKQIRLAGFNGAIMAFSADVSSRTSKLAKEAGVNHYFVKSTFNKELATALINNYCEIKIT